MTLPVKPTTGLPETDRAPATTLPTNKKTGLKKAGTGGLPGTTNVHYPKWIREQEKDDK